MPSDELDFDDLWEHYHLPAYIILVIPWAILNFSFKNIADAIDLCELIHWLAQ